VKVPVAAASRTRKRRTRSLTGASHEFPATIHCVASRVGGMILLALPVSNIPHRRRRGVISLDDHLSLFHLRKTLTAARLRTPDNRKESWMDRWILSVHDFIQKQAEEDVERDVYII